MALETWGLLFLTCLLGAMSPGPSLICILQIALKQGRRSAFEAALSHGLAVAIWAGVTVFGLWSLFVSLPIAKQIITGLGGIYLIYLGVKSLQALGVGPHENKNDDKAVQNNNPFVAGFSIAFLNPKLAIFFTALFSQFLSNNLTVSAQWLMVFIAGSIDAVWYLLIAYFVSLKVTQRAMLSRLRWIDLLAGVVFIVIGANVILHALREFF